MYIDIFFVISGARKGENQTRRIRLFKTKVSIDY